MPTKILNRYNQTQITTQFSQLTHTFLSLHNRTPLQRILLLKVLIALLIVILIYFNQHYKETLFSSIPSTILLCLSYSTLVGIYYCLEIKNGALVGEYYFGGEVERYELRYVPLSNRCSIVEKRSGVKERVREIEWKYNEFVDSEGNILEKEYWRFLDKWVGKEEVDQGEVEEVQEGEIV